MAVTSVTNICKQLISLAIQRCRSSGDPSRLSVVVRRSTISNTVVTQISISDTGAGSCLKEFQDIKYTHNRLSAVEWDGMLSITTTGIGDAEIFHYNVNLKKSAPSRRLTKLPPSSKNNAIFSGTEVSMSTTEDMEVLLADMTVFLKKNVAIELVGEVSDEQGSRSKHVALATELRLPSLESSNLEHLTSGLEDYVYKHGDRLSEICQSCFVSSGCLKVGSGQACAKKNMKDTLVVEAVIMISESSGPSSPSCLKAFEPKTEVLYFRDFSPCSVHQSALKALRSIKWTNYGLTLKNIADDEAAQLEWENFPLNTHIDIVLHCYNNQVSVPPLKQRPKVETKLMKEAISLALDDLKEKYSGALLSAHAIKINTYAPDLAKSIAGLITTSNDPNFQGECLGLLGMEMANVEGASVEECIKLKILSVIDISDRRPPSLKHVDDVPFLFGDELNQEPENMWYDYDREEEECTLMDF
ncbi:hypothetical protein RND81_11G017900 [Saponaria officinalis]|uniref:Type 2 DNA topoisomerase 6 subunit B-like n=1 Tax=Saponaria officinalis TaxID=3572 RepID=A0AAW1HHM3_SAPOF